MPSTARIAIACAAASRLATGSRSNFGLRNVMSCPLNQTQHWEKYSVLDPSALCRTSGMVSDHSPEAHGDEYVPYSLSPTLGPCSCRRGSPRQHWVRRTPPFLRILRRFEDVAHQRHEHRTSDHVCEASTGALSREALHSQYAVRRSAPKRRLAAAIRYAGVALQLWPMEHPIRAQRTINHPAPVDDPRHWMAEDEPPRS